MCKDEFQGKTDFYWCSQIDIDKITIVVCILGEFVR